MGVPSARSPKGVCMGGTSVLAKHYGLSEEELDFVINYDIKIRMGRDVMGEDK